MSYYRISFVGKSWSSKKIRERKPFWQIVVVSFGLLDGKSLILSSFWAALLSGEPLQNFDFIELAEL